MLHRQKIRRKNHTSLKPMRVILPIVTGRGRQQRPRRRIHCQMKVSLFYTHHLIPYTPSIFSLLCHLIIVWPPIFSVTSYFCLSHLTSPSPSIFFVTTYFFCDLLILFIPSNFFPTIYICYDHLYFHLTFTSPSNYLFPSIYFFTKNILYV